VTPHAEKEATMALYTPACLSCIYFHRSRAVKTGQFSCAAFDEIPLDILMLRASHEFPYPGDQGLRHSRDPSLPPEPEPTRAELELIQQERDAMEEQLLTRPEGPIYYRKRTRSF
jgi:hypothetical protein